jgi:putative addiction module component (TIGR02574 family)
MTIEIRDASLEARIQKQLQATDSSSVEEVLCRLLDTQEEQDRWLEVRACMREKTALGLGAYERFASQIKSLSAAEKADLLDTVWESLEADAASLTDAQRAELDSRIARHEQNPSDVIPWQQVRAALLRRRDL